MISDQWPEGGHKTIHPGSARTRVASAWPCAGERSKAQSYRMSKTELLSLTIRLPAAEHSALCAKPNRSAWVRNAIDEKLQRETARSVKPRTALGRKLLAARAEYQAAGGRPLSLDEVRQEVARRRGER